MLGHSPCIRARSGARIVGHVAWRAPATCDICTLLLPAAPEACRHPLSHRCPAQNFFSGFRLGIIFQKGPFAQRGICQFPQKDARGCPFPQKDVRVPQKMSIFRKGSTFSKLKDVHFIKRKSISSIRGPMSISSEACSFPQKDVHFLKTRSFPQREES